MTFVVAEMVIRHRVILSQGLFRVAGGTTKLKKLRVRIFTVTRNI